VGVGVGVKRVEALRIGGDQTHRSEGLRCCPGLCCVAARCGGTRVTYCVRCDLLVGLGDLRVTTVDVDAAVGLLTVGVESARSPMGCLGCGVIADGHGRSDVTLVDAPCFDRIVRIVWRKRTWCCGERSLCEGGVHAAEPGSRGFAGRVDHACVLVGGQAASP